MLLFTCKKQNMRKNTITVFCAASLSPVINEIKSVWEKEHSEKLVINSGSSGTLARQIENGAHADLFVSANDEWTNYLKSSLKLENQPKTVASNQLVVGAPFASSIDSVHFNRFLESLSSFKGKASTGNPGHVPLGKYAKQFLDYHNIFELLSQRLILTKDARSALRLIELGEVEFGFIYRSDALTSDKVRIISKIPVESHEPIIYQALKLSDSESVDKFLEFLSSDEQKYIWKSGGFLNE